jgi:hypothetical protein
LSTAKSTKTTNRLRAVLFCRKPTCSLEAPLIRAHRGQYAEQATELLLKLHEHIFYDDSFDGTIKIDEARNQKAPSESIT